VELIQNTDDNSYKDVTPTLSLTYDDDGLRIDCNEIGFMPNDVEALCTIGQSTKAGINKSARYIGEKGIGFKSVFKAADVVWISSGGYSFNFDKRESLGMITPLWTPFPKKTLPGYTSFYMKFSAAYDKEELLKDLNSLDPRMLTFLRRLRTINLTINQNGKPTKRRLCRADELVDSALIISLAMNDSISRYLVRHHTVKNLPSEEKRPHCHESEILLAFPLAEPQADGMLGSKAVYAFLPIRDYGLPVSSNHTLYSQAYKADLFLVPSTSRLSAHSKPRRYRYIIQMEPYALQCFCGCLYNRSYVLCWSLFTL